MTASHVVTRYLTHLDTSPIGPGRERGLRVYLPIPPYISPYLPVSQGESVVSARAIKHVRELTAIAAGERTEPG